MKKFIFLLLISISASLSAQQMVRGYTASFAYGFLAKGDDFTIKYGETDNYLATARKAQGSCINLGFPFDFGFKRSRLVLTPGLSFISSNYTLDIDPDISGLRDSDSTRLSSFIIAPQIGIMYKYHFYVGKLHFALGAGLDFVVPVSNSITFTDKNKTDLIEYSETPDQYADALIFAPNTVYSNLADISFHINPKIGFDIHIAKYLVTNLFYTTSPMTRFSDTPALRGYAGIGATYLMPMGKEDDSRLLQYYKQ